MKYKLICVDLDGTLLDDEKRIPKRAKESLVKASQKGIRIALVTGRMVSATTPIERELGIPCIKACSAGTYILNGEECIYAEYLTCETMLLVYRKYALPNHIPLWIYREDEWFVTAVDEYVQNEIATVNIQPIIVEIEELAEKWNQEQTGPSKVLFGAPKEMIDRIASQMKQDQELDADSACSAEFFLEISPKGMTKGKALSKICENLHIKKEETIAIGDQELDIPMFMEAGVGIAVGNAIPELKEIADFVTASNNEAGIADGLEHYL